MSDFWWTPESVSVLNEENATITHSERNEFIFNQVIPHGPISDTESFFKKIAKLHPNISRWVCTELCDLGLLALLQRKGYKAEDEHGAFVIDVNQLTKRKNGHVIHNVKDMKLMKRMSDMRTEIFGGIFPSSQAQLELELRQCANDNPKVERFVVEIDGELAGTGSITYFEQLNFAFIWAGGVKEKFRGQGLYSSLLQKRALACKERNIHYMGLYAKNKTSAPIVAAQGFEKVGTMIHYERKEPI